MDRKDRAEMEMEQAYAEMGPSPGELAEWMSEDINEVVEPCETCERSHNPNTPCGM